MKKPKNVKGSTSKKSIEKTDADSLRKPAKLKPLKEKGNKNWKQNIDDEEEDFDMNDEMNLDSFDEENDFYTEDDF